MTSAQWARRRATGCRDGQDDRMALAELALGVDVGGTKMAAGLVDRDGEVVASARTPTPARATADDMLIALVGVIRKVMEKAGSPDIIGVGVGCAGPMIVGKEGATTWQEGVVSPVNIPAWRGYPLRRELMGIFPGLPVRVHNDAVAVAVAEHWVGAARGYANALGMVISTGVGGGFVLGNSVIDGGLGNAGHIGHMVVYPEGPTCRCGGRGCLEPMASGPAITAWAVEEGWTPRTDGQPVDAKTLAADARDGDPIAIAAYRRSGDAVGIALASVAALIDLDIAVIGGGLVQSRDLLRAPMLDAFHLHAGLPHAARLKIEPAQLGQAAGMIGAAALIQDGDRYWNDMEG